MSLQKNCHCQIVVDSHLRALGDASGRVYALGECVQVEGHSLPLHSVLSLLCDPVSCGQVAELHLAKALCHCATAETSRARRLCTNHGMLAYVGGYKSLHDTLYSKSQGKHTASKLSFARLPFASSIQRNSISKSHPECICVGGGGGGGEEVIAN